MTLQEDGSPVTTTDNAGQGLTKPELPMKMSTLDKVKSIIRRKKIQEVPPKVL